VVHAADARRLLGLSAEQASDLVLDVYHEEEIDVVARDLVRSLPWPVHISTRPETARRLRTELAARSAGISVAFVPAGLALATLVGAVGLAGRRQRRRIALFKALGWTSADILSLQLALAMLISLPALLVGLAAGYLLLFWPGIPWVGRLLFGWSSTAPALYLTAHWSCGSLLATLLLVAVPFWAASFWVGRQGAQADPADLLEET
jgi:ABC-type lipoprotein release transport system permease subunit